MSTHKHFDKICCAVLAVSLLLTILFMNAESFGVQKASAVMGYESKLFNTSIVHTIEIVMEDWDEFIENCKSEEYDSCTVIIDNDVYKNVAIRGKGNTSLTQVDAYGNDRYSFKIEFDHYDAANTYYGLDKLCLNNIIQDNTYMKDYLCYQMMADMGVASPLCSYVYVTVNGEDWGLYLAVEGIEEAFLQRNYGSSYGNLYKPDSQSMGGGRGNGEKFDIDDFLGDHTASEALDSMQGTENETADDAADPMKEPPDGDASFGTSAGDQAPDITQGENKGGMTNGSDDVLLKYIDDTFESYANIFDNAKTAVSDSDKERLIAALKKLNSGEALTDTVDIEKVIRYFVVHNFVLNFDSYTGSMIHNYYLYEKDGQLQMIPWDYNLAFGAFEAASDASSLVNYPIDSPVSGGNTEDRPMIAWIFENEEYTELYHQYFAEFISEYFDSGYFEEQIDNVSSMIAPYVKKDPTKFCTYEEFETGVSTLKEFCLLRAKSVAGQLNGTIGSTSDTQKSDTLIDAGNLQITDMGSMNNSMGGGMGTSGDQMDSHTQFPQNDSGDAGASEPPDRNTDRADYSTQSSAPMQTPPEKMDEDSNSGSAAPEMPDGGFETPNGSSETPDGDNFNDGNINFTPPDRGNGMAPDTGTFDKQDENGTPDENNRMNESGQSASNPSDSWIWIGISAGVLALGLLFAILFKRRKAF